MKPLVDKMEANPYGFRNAETANPSTATAGRTRRRILLL
jgi:hypothetical protein